MNTKLSEDHRGITAAIELVVVPLGGDRPDETAERMAALRRYLRKTGRSGWTTSIEPGLDALPLKERRAKLSNRDVDVVAVVRMADVSIAANPGRVDVASLDRLLAPLDRHERAGLAVMARRTMLKSFGGLGLGLALAACGSKASTGSALTTTTTSTAAPSTSSGSTTTTTTTAATATSAVTLAPETTEGPYYLDLDFVRSDLREDRLGVPLVLDITVVDDQGKAIKGAAVDIWHCDAGGVYSGFASPSTGAGGGTPPSGSGGPGGGGTPPAGGGGGAPPAGGGGGTGSYTAGNRTVSQGTATDSSKFLRGTQMTFFDDTLSDKIYSSTTPYSSHSNRDTRNSNDSIYQAAASGGLLDVQASGSGYKSSLRMAVKAG